MVICDPSAERLVKSDTLKRLSVPCAKTTINTRRSRKGMLPHNFSWDRLNRVCGVNGILNTTLLIDGYGYLN